jgi:hypothetical protein
MKNDFFHLQLGIIDRICCVQCDKNALFMHYFQYFIG